MLKDRDDVIRCVRDNVNFADFKTKQLAQDYVISPRTLDNHRVNFIHDSFSNKITLAVDVDYFEPVLFDDMGVEIQELVFMKLTKTIGLPMEEQRFISEYESFFK